MRVALTTIMIAATMSMAGCASGPKFADAQADLPKLADGQARVYFYRSQAASGLAVQPGIYLNGQKVGDCEPKGIFITDVPPGDYEASVTTEVERKVSFSLAAAEEKFVRCRVGIGFVIGHGILELVDPGKARREMENLAFTGRGELPVAAK